MKIQLTILLLLSVNFNALAQADKKFTSLEEAMEVAEEVKWLELTAKETSGFFENIGRFTNLRSLYLVNCGLAGLPEEIGQLSNLTLLNVRDNRLTDLPVSLSELKNLRVINIRNNALNELSPVLKALP